MTSLPSEVDSPESLLEDLAALRNEALAQNDFKYAVHLSHCYKWLHWLSENFEALKRIKYEAS